MRPKRAKRKLSPVEHSGLTTTDVERERRLEAERLSRLTVAELTAWYRAIGIEPGVASASALKQKGIATREVVPAP